jgi:3-methyladenine DNA glycosylase AlkC
LAEQGLLKHQLGKGEVNHLADVLAQADSQFDSVHFKRYVFAKLEQLELKQRVHHIIDGLKQYLPSDFEQSAKVLFTFSEQWRQQTASNWGSFTVWPIVDYVAEVGLNDPERSLRLLKTLTPLFSAEFAIRPFIEQHFQVTYNELLKWADNESEHVRRLASEGIRPRLPWGKRLTRFVNEPAPILRILDKLKDDPSLYVRKSVANNLNDISKDNPEVVISLCSHWWPKATEQRKWVIRHGLRSLVKAGHPKVFPLLGYTENPSIDMCDFSVASQINLGESLIINCGFFARETQQIVLDYKISFMKANGRHSTKVFKWKNLSLAQGQEVLLRKEHSFKPLSTRRYYPGEHAIELLINGMPIAKSEFRLTMT